MRKVILSKRASQKLDRLINYLETEWSKKIKNEFIIKLDKSLNRIKRFPESTEKSNIKKGLHKCVITKQTSIYYFFDDEYITVVTIFDNRMNPRKLKYEI